MDIRCLLKEYDKIPKNSITIEYFNESYLKIFGKDFVENNKDNGYLIIENKKYNIQQYCPIKAKSEKIKIKLIEKTIISNILKCFINAHHYYRYLTFQNGILIMLII